jgi:3D (Asp-Asp-Asp) domain-containing protein
LMKLSKILGSALTVLLVFSVFSYANTLIQAQDPKPAVKQEVVLEVAGQIPVKQDETPAAPVVESTPPASVEKSANPAAPVVPGETYSATAYSLRGRTASGQYVTRGLIAADPRVLPLGTRVRLDAGAWSGEYVVADTGGAIRGRKIDIWTPTSREAMRFGRRPVKVTILSLAQRAKRLPSRQLQANPVVVVTPVTAEAAKENQK